MLLNTSTALIMLTADFIRINETYTKIRNRFDCLDVQEDGRGELLRPIRTSAGASFAKPCKLRDILHFDRTDNLSLIASITMLKPPLISPHRLYRTISRISQHRQQKQCIQTLTTTPSQNSGRERPGRIPFDDLKPTDLAAYWDTEPPLEPDLEAAQPFARETLLSGAVSYHPRRFQGARSSFPGTLECWEKLSY